MKIQSIADRAFQKYGRVIKDVDFSELLVQLRNMPVPEGVAYEPSVAALEATGAYAPLKDRVYGELPIEIGYCNGHNRLLNAVEYHRSSEIDIAATDLILLLGAQQDIAEDHTYRTEKIEAFLVPAGTAVELYATTLHYAPCGVDGEAFRCGVVLPKGTNLPLDRKPGGGEYALLAAKNKWLIGHPEGGLPEGSFIGLIGENLCL